MKIRKASIITKLVVVVLVGYAAITIIGLNSKIEAAEAAKRTLAQEVAEKEEQNTELEYSIKHSSDPDTIEKVAREKLGLVKPGEIIFYDVSS